MEAFNNPAFLIDEKSEIVFSNKAALAVSEVKKESHGACHAVIFGLKSTCEFCSYFSRSANLKRKYFSSEQEVADPRKEESHYIHTQLLLRLEQEGRLLLEIFHLSGTPEIEVQEHLVTLGALIQTVGHELSTPLTGLNLTCQTLFGVLQREGPVNKERLEKIAGLLNKDIERASSIVSDLRNYYREPGFLMRRVNLRELILSALNSIRRTLPASHIKIVWRWDIPENATIPGNRYKLEQCFLNILKNSVEAFTYARDVEKPKIVISGKTLPPEGENFTAIAIQIIDNAGGVSKKDIEKVFEPYFTTKKKYHGMGLGLYIVRKILREHDASIRVQSYGGKTVVSLRFHLV